jgi:hypothetical protein
LARLAKVTGSGWAHLDPRGYLECRVGRGEPLEEFEECLKGAGARPGQCDCEDAASGSLGDWLYDHAGVDRVEGEPRQEAHADAGGYQRLVHLAVVHANDDPRLVARRRAGRGE